MIVIDPDTIEVERTPLFDGIHQHARELQEATQAPQAGPKQRRAAQNKPSCP